MSIEISFENFIHEFIVDLVLFQQILENWNLISAQSYE